jgi:hypothetical protein
MAEPDFIDEAEEREFWLTQDTTEYGYYCPSPKNVKSAQ